MAYIGRNLCRAANRTLRQTPLSASTTSNLARSSFAAISLRASTRSSRSSFSTMSALKSAVVAEPKAEKDYDPEIVDMAKYIHNYDIKSDLAVSRQLCGSLSTTSHLSDNSLANYCSSISSTPPASSSSTPSAAASKPSNSPNAPNSSAPSCQVPPSPMVPAYPAHPTSSTLC